MARFSLQTLELVSQLQYRTAEAYQAGNALARAVPGQIIRAEVLQSLGNNLFLLNVRGNEVVGSSSQPLTPGQAINVQVGTTVNGQTSLQLVSANAGALADVAGRPDIAGLENNQPPEAQQRLAVLGESNPQARSGVVQSEPAVLGQLRNVVGSADTAASKEAQTAQQLLAQLIRPDGPIARLLAQRPDLTSRIEQLLTPLQNRPGSLGQQLQELTNQLTQLIRTAAPAQQASLANTQNRLVGQLLGLDLLNKPQQLAQFLSDRVTSLARGLEANVARAVATPTAPATVATGPVAAGSPTPGQAAVGQAAAGQATAGQTATGQAAAGRPAVGQAAAGSLVPGAQTAGLSQSAAATSTAAAPGSAAAVAPGLVAPGTVPANVAAAATDQIPIPTPGQIGAAAAVTAETLAANPEALLAQAENLGTAANAARSAGGSTPNVGSNAIIQSAFEGDLKGQLLELRSQLQTLAGPNAEPPPNVQHAIAQVDMLLDQVAAQQVRNLDGLNHFMYVEVPIDPRSGIHEARLQVFYRKNAKKRDIDFEQFTVAVFLNLTRLGDLMAVVTGAPNGVTVGFTVEDERVGRLLAGQSEELRTGLVEAGHPAATVTVTTVRSKGGTPEENAAAAEEEDLWPDFLGAQSMDDAPGGLLDSEA